MQPLVRRLAGTLAALAVVALAAGGPAAREARAGNPCYHGFQQPALTVEASTGVKLAPCAFEPTVAVVPVGATVTFGSASDGMVHLITGANQAWGERDTEVLPGARVTYTFDEPGVYPYACALHPGMSGAIVVGDGGSALAAAVAEAAAGGGVAVPDSGAGGAAAAQAGSEAPGSGSERALLVGLGLAAILAIGIPAWLMAGRRTAQRAVTE